MELIDTFEKSSYLLEEKSYTVFRKGEGPPVIIIHELPGMVRQCFEFADRLVKAGFRVYLPLIFGEPMKRDTVGNFREVCISKEFYILKKNQTSPIIEKLKALCRMVYAENPGKGVGAIGMCLSGGFAIPMLLEPSLVAPVLSQPAMPLLNDGLGISKEELEKIVLRVKEEDITIKAYRFKNDGTAPKSKIRKYQAAFESHFDYMELEPHKKKCHAVFTIDFINPETGQPTKDTKEALENLISYFNERLM